MHKLFSIMISLLPIIMPYKILAITVEVNEVCNKGIDGLPVTDLSGIACSIRAELREWNGESLADLTNHMVTALKLEAPVFWSTTSSQIETMPTNQLEIKIPTQQIKLAIKLAIGPDFLLELAIAPALRVAGNSVCQLQVEQVQLNIQRFDSNLEGWLNQTLMESFNRDPAIINPLHDSLKNAIRNFQAEQCQLAKAPLPAEESLDSMQADIEELRRKYQQYLRLSEQQLDAKSWPMDTHCDGLLITSLYAVAGGTSQVELAEDPWQPGRYFRHWQQNCYANYQAAQSFNASKSTISRDMLMGLAHWLWNTENSHRLRDLIRFGEDHSLAQLPLIWIMGEGQSGRTDLTPALMQTFYQMNEKLNGEPQPAIMDNWNFQVWGPCEGYRCHLMVLHMLLRWRVHGEIEDLAVQQLAWLVHREPHNALYATAFGMVTGTSQAWPQALRTLLNPQWFPPDQLPSSNQRCSYYIFERDYLRDGVISQDWLPCPEQERNFSGIDFLFASSLLLEAYDALVLAQAER